MVTYTNDPILNYNTISNKITHLQKGITKSCDYGNRTRRLHKGAVAKHHIKNKYIIDSGAGFHVKNSTHIKDVTKYIYLQTKG